MLRNFYTSRGLGQLFACKMQIWFILLVFRFPGPILKLTEYMIDAKSKDGHKPCLCDEKGKKDDGTEKKDKCKEEKYIEPEKKKRKKDEKEFEMDAAQEPPKQIKPKENKESFEAAEKDEKKKKKEKHCPCHKGNFPLSNQSLIIKSFFVLFFRKRKGKRERKEEGIFEGRGARAERSQLLRNGRGRSLPNHSQGRNHWGKVRHVENETCFGPRKHGQARRKSRNIKNNSGLPFVQYMSSENFSSLGYHAARSLRSLRRNAQQRRAYQKSPRKLGRKQSG